MRHDVAAGRAGRLCCQHMRSGHVPHVADQGRSLHRLALNDSLRMYTQVSTSSKNRFPVNLPFVPLGCVRHTCRARKQTSKQPSPAWDVATNGSGSKCAHKIIPRKMNFCCMNFGRGGAPSGSPLKSHRHGRRRQGPAQSWGARPRGPGPPPLPASRPPSQPQSAHALFNALYLHTIVWMSLTISNRCR